MNSQRQHVAFIQQSFRNLFQLLSQNPIFFKKREERKPRTLLIHHLCVCWASFSLTEQRTLKSEVDGQGIARRLGETDSGVASDRLSIAIQVRL
jgi:hypothetical protein